MEHEAIPDSTEERARLLESILLSAIENKNGQGDGMAYVKLRHPFIQDPVLMHRLGARSHLLWRRPVRDQIRP